MDSHEKALSSDPYKNRKGTATHYANGKPKVAGKTQAQIKREQKEAWKNRHNDPAYKGIGPGYVTPEIKKAASTMPKKKDRYGWAGKVGEAHLKNQKAQHEKGYREDYR